MQGIGFWDIIRPSVRGGPSMTSPPLRFQDFELDPAQFELGRAGHRTVLHLSSAWGGLEQRKPLIESILSYVFPTAPKLRPQPATLT